MVSRVRIHMEYVDGYLRRLETILLNGEVVYGYLHLYDPPFADGLA